MTTSPLHVLTLYIVPSAGHKANHCPFAIIDALNEKHSITTSLVHALEFVPPSIASSSSYKQDDKHDDNEQDDKGNTESILEDAKTLQRYLTASAHSTSHLVSSQSSASTVKSHKTFPKMFHSFLLNLVPLNSSLPLVLKLSL